MSEQFETIVKDRTNNYVMKGTVSAKVCSYQNLVECDDDVQQLAKVCFNVLEGECKLSLA
jgi:hypothetical protein